MAGLSAPALPLLLLLLPLLLLVLHSLLLLVLLLLLLVLLLLLLSRLTLMGRLRLRAMGLGTSHTQVCCVWWSLTVHFILEGACPGSIWVHDCCICCCCCWWCRCCCNCSDDPALAAEAGS
jgi:hypothetical protein